VIEPDVAALLTALRAPLRGRACECGHVPAWPLGTASEDEKHLGILADALGWCRADYESFVLEVKALMRSNAFRRPYEALYAALGRTRTWTGPPSASSSHPAEDRT
jgi:hypothetical protein